jgi:hypothetical protein
MTFPIDVHEAAPLRVGEQRRRKGSHSTYYRIATESLPAYYNNTVTDLETVLSQQRVISTRGRLFASLDHKMIASSSV